MPVELEPGAREMPGRRRRAAVLSALAAGPAVALAAVVLPCACPDHQAHPTVAGVHADAMSVGEHGMAHHATSARTTGYRAAPMRMAWDDGRPGLIKTARPRPLGATTVRYAPASLRTARAATDRSASGGGRHPLDRPAGPAGQPLPGHGAGDPGATRAALTTSQATAKLSRRCRKLLSAKRPSRLSAADRRRRSACVRQRRALMQAEQQAPVSTTPPATNTPAATTPSPSPAPAPTPAPAPSVPPIVTPTPTPAPAVPCANVNPCYAAVGVQAIDNDVAFKYTSRGIVTADIVSFQLDNQDQQLHNLYWATASASGTVTGPLHEIFGNTGPSGDSGIRPTKNVALAPGNYKLICTIGGHGPMAVNFTVIAPSR
jgi:hypothetical protein